MSDKWPEIRSNDGSECVNAGAQTGRERERIKGREQ